MAEFKKLGAVEAVETVSDAASVLIEENGVIKRAPKDEIGGGIKVASTAQVGQTIVVKAIDENGNPTEWECADKGGQADWNENDETSVAYIHNKPFYEIVTETVAIESQTVNLTVSGNFAYSALTHVNDIPWDGICKVIFDGVVYDYIAAYESASDMSICVNFTTENGEEVYIYDSRSISGPASLAGQHTVEVFIKDINKKTLDEKFIPFSIKNGTGQYSLMFNKALESSGSNSHAEGNHTTASGSNSHAEGYFTFASGSDSHAEGYSTTASGSYSHAEGQLTTASGGYSHAEGCRTTASGDHSHAEGYQTIASHRSQSVEGEYNIMDPSANNQGVRGTYVHIVGNGTTNSKRSNAHTLDWDGNAWYQGEVYVGGMSQDDENAVKLAKVTDISEAMQDFVFDQADWNEFDETSMAYIKNKPFGEFKEIYYAKQTVNCTDLGKYVFPSDYKCAKIERIAEAPWNEKCTIILDDIVYENVLVTEHGVEMTSLIEFLTNNGDKIIIDIAGNVLGVPPALAGEHTIEVFKTATSIVQLDNKFIPYILNSSTEGSTKRFRITVDDSGTLSAVEVTE